MDAIFTISSGDMDDECLLINTSIPGYHISLAYLPALNYSCDMDIRPISIYFTDQNSQNSTEKFNRDLMLKHFFKKERYVKGFQRQKRQEI